MSIHFSPLFKLSEMITFINRKQIFAKQKTLFKDLQN